MPAINQFGAPVAQNRAYRFGRLVSQIFHPIVNGIAAFALVGLVAPEIPSARTGLLWALACMVTIITPTAVFFYARLLSGAYSDDDVSRRDQRTGLYLMSIVSTVVGSAVLYWAGLPPIFLRLLVVGIAVIGICMLINFAWKISVHSASIGTLASLATFYLREWGLILWACAAVVGWARVRTGNHTLMQVLAGWTVALVGVLLAFRLRM